MLFPLSIFLQHFLFFLHHSDSIQQSSVTCKLVQRVERKIKIDPRASLILVQIIYKKKKGSEADREMFHLISRDEYSRIQFFSFLCAG